MKGMWFRLLAAAILVVFPAPVSSASSPEDQARKSALVWLSFVDAGNIAASWSTASDTFKRTVPQEAWEQSLGAIRRTLGGVVSRRLKSARYTKSLPDAPDGQYVVLQFATSFANEKSTIETVTPMLDRDGRWRVFEYQIKCLAPL